MINQNRISDYATSPGTSDPSTATRSTAESDAKTSSVFDFFGRQISQHPAIAIALGVSVGCVLGWVVKRR